jgi:hypothetical protein
MDSLGGSIGNRLYDHVALGLWMYLVYKKVYIPLIKSGYVCVWRLAYFALKVLPDVRVHQGCLLHVLFAFQPFLEATSVNKLHGASATARANQLIRVFFLWETNTTDVLILGRAHLLLSYKYLILHTQLLFPLFLKRILEVELAVVEAGQGFSSV